MVMNRESNMSFNGNVYKEKNLQLSAFWNLVCVITLIFPPFYFKKEIENFKYRLVAT